MRERDILPSKGVWLDSFEAAIRESDKTLRQLHASITAVQGTVNETRKVIEQSRGAETGAAGAHQAQSADRRPADLRDVPDSSGARSLDRAAALPDQQL